jgi:hypothetical protein
MSDIYEHNSGDHEDPLPGPTWVIGILGSVLLGVVVLGVTALFFNADSRMVDDKVMSSAYPEYQDLKAEQMAKIEGQPRMVQINENDQVVDTVVIPIDQAMARIAQRGSTSTP